MNDLWANLSSWAWSLLKVMAVLAVIAGIVYWVKFSPLPAFAHQIKRGAIIAEVMGTGTLEARVQTTISAKISGRVIKLHVDQGDRVTAGDLLVELDDEELDQQVEIAKANQEAASAAITRLEADKARAEAVYELARKSQERIQTLIAKKAVTEDEADKAAEALAVAETGVARAEAAIQEGQKELIAAEKNLEYHRARFRETQIHAPFDGLIVKRNREPGDIVVPGSSIFTLISTEELWISAWVDETEMSGLAQEQPARVVFRSEPNQSYLGKVVRLGREADRETREFVVDVAVLKLPENWAVGQRAEVFIQTEQKHDVLLLPADLIERQDDQLGVFVMRDGAAQWQPVRLGIQSRDAVEVIDGLSEGEVVITATNPTAKLSTGRKVYIP